MGDVAVVPSTVGRAGSDLEQARTRPIVSVLIPTYNHADLLPLALGDALGQSLAGDIEVLVGDDASTDGTAGVLARVTDPRVAWWRRPVNLGAAGNVRALLEAARGTYVAVLNDDDRWRPHLLRTLVAPLDADPTVVAAFSLWDVIDAGGAVLPAATAESHRALGVPDLAPGRHQPFLDRAVRKSMPSNLCTVFRRDALPAAEIPGDVGAAYDLWISYLACRDGGAVVYVDQTCASFRQHAASTTAAGGARISAAESAVYRRLLADRRLAAQRGELKATYAAVLVAAAGDQARGGDRRHAARTLAASVAARPSLGALRAALELCATPPLRPPAVGGAPPEGSGVSGGGAGVEADRAELAGFVPAAARGVLDVGCSTGAFGQLLRSLRPVEVLWGVEPRAAAAEVAAGRYDHVAVGLFPDVVGAGWPAFDCILFNDVLEHTMDPDRCLRAAATLLAPGGHVIASIPNVRFAEHLYDLVAKGRWTYRDSGILDRTHVRFFTRSSIVELFEGAGYRVDAVTPINKFVSHRWSRALGLLGRPVDELTHMQFVVDATTA